MTASAGAASAKGPFKPADTPFAKLVGVVTLIGGAGATRTVIQNLGRYVPRPDELSWGEQADILLKIAVLVLIVHAVAWERLQKRLGANYSTGATPKGLHAIIMSLSLTVPALTIPVIYAQATGAKSLVFINHWRGAIISVALGAIAYVFLFGMDEHVFPGVRELLLRRFKDHPYRWMGEISATFAYAVILVLSIATPYRLIVLPKSPVYADFAWPALASLMTACGLSAYIGLTYPASLEESGYVFLRGVIAGIFTVLSTCTALYGG